MFLKEYGWSHWEVLNHGTNIASGTYGLNLQGSSMAFYDNRDYDLPHGNSFYMHVDGWGVGLPEQGYLSARPMLSSLTVDQVLTGLGSESSGLSVRCVRDL